MLSDPSSFLEDATSTGSVGLTVEERRYLLGWVKSARTDGIDAADDLRLRPWPVPISASVIGVFRLGEDMASWLVVGQQGLWTVVSVADGSMVDTKTSLEAALSLIHRPRELSGVMGKGPEERGAGQWPGRR